MNEKEKLERDQAKEYIKQWILKTPVPGSNGDLPNEEQLKHMPEEFWNVMIDMLLGFKQGGTKFHEIMTEYNKKVHSDTSFGMTVKEILSKK